MAMLKIQTLSAARDYGWIRDSFT